MAPGLHDGEQVGGAQSELVQTCEPQSALAPHDAPWLQWGAQPGARHKLPVHTREPHWLLPLQAFPSGQVPLLPQLTEQLGPVYPIAQVQTPLLQVPWLEQVGPPGQVTEQSAPE